MVRLEVGIVTLSIRSAGMCPRRVIYGDCRFRRLTEDRGCPYGNLEEVHFHAGGKAGVTEKVCDIVIY